MDGRLQAGDRILAVDNQVLNSVTHEEAVYKLTQTGAVVNLKIARESQVQHELSGSFQFRIFFTEEHFVRPSDKISSKALLDPIEKYLGHVFTLKLRYSACYFRIRD